MVNLRMRSIVRVMMVLGFSHSLRPFSPVQPPHSRPPRNNAPWGGAEMAEQACSFVKMGWT